MSTPFWIVYSNLPRLSIGFWLKCLLAVLLMGCSSVRGPTTVPRLRGAYIQAESIATPEKADQTLARIEQGHFEAVFVNVFAFGYAYYDSTILEKHPDVANDFDPLAHVIERARELGIQVHTWLVVGPVGYDGPGPILSEHPGWAMIGPDGRQSYWLNYTRPDVREFIGDLAVELVDGYDIDGVHFDYARYPGTQWGFDSYSVALFSEEHRSDLNLLRYEELPAYATFTGNPLSWPATAEVLAEFDNGQPAVLINEFGEGQSILLNWDASEREVVAGGQILSRSIDYLLAPGGKLYILYSEENTAKYGSSTFRRGLAWLEDLGRQPARILESEIANLNSGSVLVLPQVYLLKGQVASDLAAFVHRGGGVIFIDGPTPSIWNRDVRAVTGMYFRGRHFTRDGLLLPTREHDIIPTSNRTTLLDSYQALNAEWKAFRGNGISKMLEEVHERIESKSTEVQLSISLAIDQELLAQQHLLDWQTWLEAGTVDLIIPRAYVAQNEYLARAIADWKPTMKESGRIVLALSTYSVRDSDASPKTPRRVLSEISLALDKGSAGVVLFDIEHTTSAMLEELAAGPFSAPEPASE